MNQEIDLDDRFDMAQNISEKVGLKLKAFIMNYKEACSNTNIRIIAHSLGAQVALWTVSKLNSDDSWRHRIQSLHLLGAAVSHDQTKSSIRLDEKTTGDAVEYEVQYAWNYYSTEDPILNYGYLFETFGQPAIGSTPGTQNPKILSCNATPIIGKAHRFYTTPYHGVVSYIVEDWESEGSKQECSF